MSEEMLIRKIVDENGDITTTFETVNYKEANKRIVLNHISMLFGEGILGIITPQHKIYEYVISAILEAEKDNAMELPLRLSDFEDAEAYAKYVIYNERLADPRLLVSLAFQQWLIDNDSVMLAESYKNQIFKEVFLPDYENNKETYDNRITPSARQEVEDKLKQHVLSMDLWNEQPFRI